MALKIKFTPAAKRDLQNAIDWEENRHIDLGRKCFNDIEERIIDISNVPEIGSIRYDDVRCVKVKHLNISSITMLK